MRGVSPTLLDLEQEEYIRLCLTFYNSGHQGWVYMVVRGATGPHWNPVAPHPPPDVMRLACFYASQFFFLFLLKFTIQWSSVLKSGNVLNKLLNIKQQIPDNIFPVFDYLDVLLDILVRGVAVLFKTRSDADEGNESACWLKG